MNLTVRILTATFVALLAALLPAAPASAAEQDSVSDAVYCVIVPPISYQGRQIWPGSEYCVPGP